MGHVEQWVCGDVRGLLSQTVMVGDFYLRYSTIRKGPVTLGEHTRGFSSVSVVLLRHRTGNNFSIASPKSYSRAQQGNFYLLGAIPFGSYCSSTILIITNFHFKKSYPLAGKAQGVAHAAAGHGDGSY